MREETGRREERKMSSEKVTGEMREVRERESKGRHWRGDECGENSETIEGSEIQLRNREREL